MPSAGVDPRLLRAFLAVAEDLHFTRAASRLYVAQQALSRDIRRLERELGAELFVRTTRQVALTSDGARLLPYARRVLEAESALLAAFGRNGEPERPLLVDVNSPGLIGCRVLDRARDLVPDIDLMARYESGLTGAAAEILAGRLDASFGRFAGLDPAVRARLDQQPVRYEPMAIVLPEDHRLAPLAEVPLSELAGETVYAGAGNPRTPEWTDLAHRLFQNRGIRMASPAPLAVGAEEFQRIMAKKGDPILAVVDFPSMPRMVLRPLVDPVPLSPVSLVWRKGAVHPGIDALRRAAVELGEEDRWLSPAEGAWLPAADALVMGAA
ncbi:LysR family transcriptional regulator [Streptomyces chiangmaiensis]|uniref:LysR family transcriptional regulator n=1 Tax=Streptomyces chiangmaiensis TaxID=766497 RepID=A0ABU7FMM0_9ACTN|nr:LysR family transcriptional regulator [Streptomyces chiangmaiensis]MED7824349.1 LysR family transcriptional regulator [Streptomyces chiangmaiensis]